MAQTAVTTAPVPSGLAVRQKPAEGLWRDAFRRLRRTRLAFASGVALLALLVVAIFAPLVAPKPYDLQDYNALTQGPGSRYWLGTDELGRDILSRLIYGARISLTVGLVVQGVILLIGVPAGLAAGYYGGKTDTIIMRTVDILYSIPSLLFIIVIMTFLRARFATADGGIGGALASLDSRTGGLLGIFIGVGLVNWMPAARLVRAQVVSLKEKEFVEAARGMGASNRRIMAQHLLPNVVATIVVTATLGIPQAIIYEAGISFLGLGARPPMPSWGLMIAEAIPSIRSYPYMLVAPALALSLTVLAFNFLGDGLRDALDPWMRR
jgi:ABC-type dipeptide/oligopeptide/nickel transport system permease subunit